jgi:pyruvate/2-oxoglutarate dehydrogenase complex dihydrolipoamide acyltransferase (E2) component
MDKDILPFPPQRKIVVDSGYLSSRRHIIYGLLEVDVTQPRLLMRAQAAASGSKISFTAFIVACLAKSIEANPQVQAYLDWRGRLVIFKEVDVVTMIEPEKGAVAIPHIIRAANRKTVREISDEIRSIQSQPKKSEQQSSLLALATYFPRFARLLFFWALKKNPEWVKRLEGTTVVTSVGMFGKGGGWGIGFLPVHTMGLTVGGIVQKPGVFEGDIAIREYLDLTLSFDHDIVDGAPAARFAKELVSCIESGAGLEEGTNAG